MPELASRLLLALLVVLSASCASLVVNPLDERYGEPRTISRVTDDPQRVALAAQARNIIEQRCAVCHGCYDAPCQLNLQSFDGIERGAHKEPVYKAERLFAAQPTRLFYDGDGSADWRQRGFHPVLNERQQTAEANLQGSLVARMLELKQAHPLPAGPLGDHFDLGLNRDQQCPTIEQFDDYAQRFPQWGMPYALPAIDEVEMTTLMDWIRQGAPSLAKPPISALQQRQVERWEAFLNASGNKRRLMARYIYEHLFLANLYFDEDPDRGLFRLVRSRSAPGQPIDPIASRFPYDDPGVDRVYYRLKPMHLTVLGKTHQAYALGDARMARYRELFVDADYNVAALPGYADDVAANPFIAFRDIPVASRYRFLLDDAKTFIEGFIKGPVCRGQVAVGVINDRFWVFFVDPDYLVTDHSDRFLVSQSKALRLPIEEKSEGLNLLTWLRYSALQKDFVQAKQRYASERLQRVGGVTLDAFWDGDGHNANAALTVFRHFDNASVVRGLVGPPPKTAWIINYSLFERIHYLLVAGFDVYGNVRHQLYARLYMDFLRMEGEFNFLSALPAHARQAERDYWYRDAGRQVTDFIDWNDAAAALPSMIDFQTTDYKRELFAMIQQRLAAALTHRYAIDGLDRALADQLQRLEGAVGRNFSWMPELSYLLVDGAPDDAALFTLMRNSAHSNVTHLFNEDKARRPDEDSLSVARGVIGNYPNAFFRLSRERLSGFVDRILQLSGADDYSQLVDDFGIRRSDARFWQISDQFHQRYREMAGIDYGLADYNRLEDR